MTRFFNTAGPCDPALHYLLPPEARLPPIEELLAERAYFVLHGPRQSGKTTAMRALAERLTATGTWAALYASCETGQNRSGDVEYGVASVLRALEHEAQFWPQALRPEPLSRFVELEPSRRLLGFLARWAEICPRPLVLLLDEIDALLGDALIAVLRQLRAGFPGRPKRFPSSVGLIGLRDVRDYHLDLGEVLGTASPFNIKIASFRLRDFNAAEVAALYTQHTQETGQLWSTAALERAFELTCGQPWLVNALARQVVMVEVPDQKCEVDVAAIERAREALIQRRDTHLDSLLERLREPRVRRILERVLSGDFLPAEVLDDDIAFCLDLGLIRRGEAGLEVANPIYREIVPRALTARTEESLPIERHHYLGAQGDLLFDRLLADFVEFWRENGEILVAAQPYSEAAAQLVFMAFLQKVVNGRAPGGLPIIEREYAVGRGRLDLHVIWPKADGTRLRFAVELKVWRQGRPDPSISGGRQLAAYLTKLGLEHGTLIIFDQRTNATATGARQDAEVDGRALTILSL